MPVTFKVAKHAAEEFPWTPFPVKTTGAERPLQVAAFAQWRQCQELLQTSIAPEDLPELEPARGNGFVEVVLTAYKRHHHLVIRPDDVWISFLSQLNFYVNTHAEELRSHFVAHGARKLLTVPAAGTRYVVDPKLVDWILPDFTTTTVKDKTICAVLLMSSLESCFHYEIMCICGIPSVTLEGERADWQKLLDRPAAWTRMLRPILERFVKAFDGKPDVEFWGNVAHAHPNYYGPEDMSGWITALSVWNCQGRWQGRPLEEVTNPREVPDAEEREKLSPRDKDKLERRYVLDGISYPALSQTQMAEGFCEVDVLLDDNGQRFDCVMVAGHVAIAVSGSAESQRDTLSPSPEWFIYIKRKERFY
ncbi:hypothetical protein DICSQDRAFT_164213 [Dichomitus squalens LYAD-421 SS1]|uniref:Uncharacterized protein n=1 Tax=Dichomitus squalens (strain LYAD-421) TaxID=732165 RepID=R7SIL8_DICSQ|nr:uncharacterized protein DICSQDRAFT_164213 [Dichomitus squalens LYAD-421 SS1]EJF55565.1 hypothetical protein DICSQDRAFT_164213 [Dichomitus squalens LYAD-421 SS1]